MGFIRLMGTNVDIKVCNTLLFCFYLHFLLSKCPTLIFSLTFTTLKFFHPVNCVIVSLCYTCHLFKLSNRFQHKYNTNSPSLPAASVNGVSVLRRLASNVINQIFGVGKQFISVCQLFIGVCHQFIGVCQRFIGVCKQFIRTELLLVPITG